MARFEAVPGYAADQIAAHARDVEMPAGAFALVGSAFHGIARGVARSAALDPDATLTLAEVADLLAAVGDSFTNVSTTMRGGQ